MADETQASVSAEQRGRALSRWDNEGGALAGPPPAHAGAIPELSNAELVQLRIRVIALENLVIALLAEGSEHQLAVVREMAAYISPRPGFTHHPLTVQAAKHMTELVDRAVHFQDSPSS